jgi:NADH-quinone oxidoreductase subunit H
MYPAGPSLPAALLATLGVDTKAPMSAQFVASMVTLLVVMHLILLSCSYLILLERKICAWIQDRIGPNRTNLSFGVLPARGSMWGLGQPLADGLKLLLKEEYTPLGVDRMLFLLAPAAVMIPALLAWAVVPWGGVLQWGDQTLAITAAPLSIGVVYILAVGSVAVYGVVLAGYASNNKYSFFGGLRATAQMLSYEIPMGLCVLVVVLMSGIAEAEGLVQQQANGVWYLFYQPLLAVIFFTCVLAECNRAPFDLAEAEQELVGGYHTEYASIKWGLFFVGEYMHMITGSAFFCILFLGGWDLPIVQESFVGPIGLVLLKFVVFLSKIFLLLALMMVVRWTLPRFRFDQLMRLAWRALIPICILLLLLSAFVVFLELSPWWYAGANLIVLGLALVIGPIIPVGPAVNRRVALPGSRFNPG